MATVTPPWAYTLQLPHDPRAPGVARQTLRTVLAAHGMGGGWVAEAAEAVAGEMVVNAYLHSDGPYTLRLRSMEPDRLRVSVWDGNPDIPPPFRGAPAADAAPHDERGRGLRIVEAYADRLGAYPLGDGGLFGEGGGKLLWAECRGG
ncbi:ATP-binding protein [Streptomyces sp. MUM 178J]|uniref:ATP-binding protein n=1 Tax=Streptomyces sp. MUM 178J TaxID=2791991 RepID=UPI001F042961|nr:ATP-binding protein [Streptomyces sp. MUM 178J]WRQ83034.1 ATP-binding protein [Streptomyces sp. MUM 178J]